MIADREIAAHKRHVADLTFTRVGEGAVIAQSVVIAVLIAGLTRKEEYQRRGFRRCDAALPLATIDVVNVTDAIVNAARLESRYASELLVGAFNVEPKFTQPACRGIVSAAKFIRFQGNAAGQIAVRHTGNGFAVIGLTIVDEKIVARLSKTIRA